MFKKKLNLILVLIICLFAFVGCKKENNEDKKDDKPEEQTYANYTIKVVDIDGEELANKKYSTKDYATVLDALKNDLNAVTYASDYGTSITSIAGSIVDSNWYLAISENGTYASTGVDGLVIDDGDVFEFTSTCWNTKDSGYGTMDDVDVKVDKIIYSYMKSYFKDLCKASADYSTGDYWTLMAITMMANNGYDANLFNVNNFPETYKASLEVSDFSSFEGAIWGKYFYGARAFNKDLTAFKEAYITYMTNTITKDTAYSEWSTPFYLSPAKYLNVSTESITTLSTTTYRAGSEWGLDGWNWEMTNLSLFNTFTLADLTETKAVDQGNGTSQALMLLPLAANNINARTVEADGVDIVEILINNYYDETLKLVKWSKDDTGVNYSTNQIYASLMAYKAQRDSGKAVNIFA